MPRAPLIRIAELPPGLGRVVTVGIHELAVFNVDGAFHVLSNLCPHAEGRLGDGPLEGCIVACPDHGWKFDVTNGENLLGRGFKKPKSYPTAIDGEWVMVELP